MNAQIEIGQTVEVTRTQWGSMTHIMYLTRNSTAEFTVKPKWQGSICYLLEDSKTFTDEAKARRWARTFA